MPEMKNYIIDQTRTVEVTANSAIEAAMIASAAFEHGQDSSAGVAAGHAPEGVWGNTTTRIREVKFNIHERWI